VVLEQVQGSMDRHNEDYDVSKPAGSGEQKSIFHRFCRNLVGTSETRSPLFTASSVGKTRTHLLLRMTRSTS